MWWREGRGSFIAKMFFISINNVILSNSFAKSESADRHFLVHQTKHRHINIPNTTTIQKSKMVMWYSSKIFLEMDNDKIFCLFSSLFSATEPFLSQMRPLFFSPTEMPRKPDLKDHKIYQINISAGKYFPPVSPIIKKKLFLTQSLFDSLGQIINHSWNI